MHVGVIGATRNLGWHAIAEALGRDTGGVISQAQPERRRCCGGIGRHGPGTSGEPDARPSSPGDSQAAMLIEGGAAGGAVVEMGGLNLSVNDSTP
jgi:hypothetical protein